MERIQNIDSTKKMIWVDGNTLVRVVGEQEARDYLHGNGYQAKLTAFIKERDRKIEEENQARQNKNKKPKIKETEPGLE